MISVSYMSDIYPNGNLSFPHPLEMHDKQLHMQQHLLHTLLA